MQLDLCGFAARKCNGVHRRMEVVWWLCFQFAEALQRLKKFAIAAAEPIREWCATLRTSIPMRKLSSAAIRSRLTGLPSTFGSCAQLLLRAVRSTQRARNMDRQTHTCPPSITHMYHTSPHNATPPPRCQSTSILFGFPPTCRPQVCTRTQSCAAHAGVANQRPVSLFPHGPRGCLAARTS